MDAPVLLKYWNKQLMPSFTATQVLGHKMLFLWTRNNEFNLKRKIHLVVSRKTKYAVMTGIFQSSQLIPVSNEKSADTVKIRIDIVLDL